MRRSSALVALAALSLAGAVGACAPISTVSGFQSVDVKPQDMKVGEDTRSSVLTKLGSPSAVATFDPNIWYYMTQSSDKVAYLRPQIKSRTVIAITFDTSSETATKSPT